MNAIMMFIQANPVTAIFLVAVAIIASVLTLTSRGGNSNGSPNPEDILPSYKRYDRREIERGDRRKTRVPEGSVEERRQGPRRKRD